MSAQEACRHGRAEVHSVTASWRSDAEPIQPFVPFGKPLMKPAHRVSCDEDFELQATAGKSVQRLISQQNQVYPQLQKQHVFLSDEFFILMRDCDGKFLESRLCSAQTEIVVEKGSLLQAVTAEDHEILDEIQKLYEGAVEDEVFYMQCVDVRNLFVRIPLALVEKLSRFQAGILKAIYNLEDRFKFFCDSELFRYVQNLKIGNIVLVQGENNLALSKFTENSRFMENEIQYFTGNLLRQPNMKPPNSQASSFFGPKPKVYKAAKIGYTSVGNAYGDQSYSTGSVRNIPIRLVPEVQKNADCVKAAFHRKQDDLLVCEMKRLTYDSSSSGTLRIVNEDSNPEVFSNPSDSCDTASPESTPILEPATSKVVPLGTSSYTESNHCPRFDETHVLRLKEGDKIIWIDLLKSPHSGFIRWIGRLKGHTQLYAGVEFDDEIGGGTGRYEGTDLFHAKRNHAGFLPVSVIRKDASNEDFLEEILGNARPNIAVECSRAGSHTDRNDEKSLYGIEPPCLPSGSCAFSEPVDVFVRSPLIPCRSNSLTKDSCVLVNYRGSQRFGVVRWIGPVLADDGFDRVASAAVEIEGTLPCNWPDALERLCNVDGQMLFFSSGDVALVPLSSLYEDERFQTVQEDSVDVAEVSPVTKLEEKTSEVLDSGIEENLGSPCTCINDLIGTMKGIQGSRNSCYLDTTLYAMFVQSSAFDHFLRVKKGNGNTVRSRFIQTLVREIISPLRKHHFVRADHVSKLRELLQSLLPHMPGLTSDEKDPEELLTALFRDVFRSEPFIFMRNLNDGKTDNAYICPLITDDVWSNQQKHLVSVQSLLERSLYSSNVQFAKAPKVLILQLPRYGKQKVFCKVIPQQELEITHLIFNVRRPCATCSKQADLICPECFLTKEILLGEVTYCKACYKRAHAGFDHQSQDIRYETRSPLDSLSRKQSVRKRKLQLSAVLSIETSHYVAFVRSPLANKWLLYDSMADRVGLEKGYNVPKVKCCERVSQWLSDSGLTKLRNAFEREHHLPSEIESDSDLMRLFSDCYICFYVASNEEVKTDYS